MQKPLPSPPPPQPPFQASRISAVVIPGYSHDVSGDISEIVQQQGSEWGLPSDYVIGSGAVSPLIGGRDSGNIVESAKISCSCSSCGLWSGQKRRRDKANVWEHGSQKRDRNGWNGRSGTGTSAADTKFQAGKASTLNRRSASKKRRYNGGSAVLERIL